MVFSRNKRQQNRRLLSQLDDFDQNIILGKAAIEHHENQVVKGDTNDRDFTVDTSINSSAINENDWMWKPWRGVLMKGLTGKWEI